MCMSNSIDQHVLEARVHIEDAMQHGYAPDPWAETIVELHKHLVLLIAKANKVCDLLQKK